ncbi:hypothetical protein [Dyella subtropica]|uniref:hypothetical protein n=1 Tax=Dyella subtropica TaxID=2992127 RepID=UPI002253A55B|nr:hypothetical protein [Dyella subtropica]
MNAHLARIATGLMVITSLGFGHTAHAQSTAVEGLSWKIESADLFLRDLGPAAKAKEPILVWSTKDSEKVATDVDLLVEAPYDRIQPAVQKALATLGAFTSNTETSYLDNDWAQVLLSRRPDLRDALATRFEKPRLQLAVKEGALTSDEMERRLARARAGVTSVPQHPTTMDAFRVAYPSYYAEQERSYGLTGKRSSKLSVRVFDVSAAFGYPATSVHISREDSYPNPKYGVLASWRDFNVLSGSRSPTLGDSVVPAPVFEAVRNALVEAADGHAMSIAPTPMAWAIPADLTALVPAFTLAAPSSDQPTLEAQPIRWDTLIGAGRDLRHPQDLLALPDGDLMLSAEILDTSGWSQRVLRLRDANGEWKVESVWRGDQSARQLALSADGHTVWFASNTTRDDATQMHAYDVATRQLASYTLGLPDTDNRINNWRWELADDQLPVIFDHRSAPLFDRDKADASKLGGERLIVMRPATPPPAAGGTWSFQLAVSSARQSMMNVRMKGNTDIWPVRWRGSKTFWTEDQPGIAELDAANGHVLRALPLPQRFGTPDRNDAGGAAAWVPTPLGSPEAGWIASGFVLMLTDDGSMPPKLDGATNRSDRFVGMHVVDLKDGRVRLSALLGRADTLQAAARSANGRLLAIGSNGIKPRGPKVVLWDIAKAQTPVRLSAPERGELHALAFSWNGADLWALSGGELLHWRLPDTLKDAAARGSFPDQSHR